MTEDLSQYAWVKLKILAGDLRKAIKERNRNITGLTALEIGAFGNFFFQVVPADTPAKGPSVKKAKKDKWRRGPRTFNIDGFQIMIVSSVLGLNRSEPMKFADIVRKVYPGLSDSSSNVRGTLEYAKTRVSFRLAMRKIEYVIKNKVDRRNLSADNQQFYNDLSAKHGLDFEVLAKLANYNQNTNSGRRRRKRRLVPKRANQLPAPQSQGEIGSIVRESKSGLGTSAPDSPKGDVAGTAPALSPPNPCWIILVKDDGRLSMINDTKRSVIVFAKKRIGEMFIDEKEIKDGLLSSYLWDDLVEKATARGFHSAVAFSTRSSHR